LEGDAGRLADDASRRLARKRGRRDDPRRKSRIGPTVAGRRNSRLELRVLHDETPEIRRGLWRFQLMTEQRVGVEFEGRAGRFGRRRKSKVKPEGSRKVGRRRKSKISRKVMPEGTTIDESRRLGS